MDNDTILRVMEKYSSDCEVGFYHDDETKTVFVGDWHSIPDYVQKYIERRFTFYEYEFRFRDEVTICSDCGKLVEIVPTSYGWIPKYWVGDGFLQCKTCAGKDNFQAYIKQLINDHNHANVLMSANELENNGFERLDQEYVSGLHPGQNDNPELILKGLLEKNPDGEFIFMIDSTGQFQIDFSIYQWIKKED